MPENRTEVTLYTDGACSGNPGKGGWASILVVGDNEKELYGSEDNTTNNRMELTAVINGLDALNRPCKVHVVTDSKYVCDAFNQGWLENWQKNHWIGSNKKPVKNIELWKKLAMLSILHDATYEWVKGHNGHPQNERCDQIASALAQGLNIEEK